MNIELKKLDEVNGEIHVQLSPEDYQPNIEKSLKDYRRKAHVPGFRQGMVPMGHIQRLYGKQIKTYETSELAQKSLFDYLENEKIKIFGGPILDVDKSDFQIEKQDKDILLYVFNIGIRNTPKISLNKRNKITYNKILGNDELLEAMIKEYQIRFGKFLEVEKIEENDLVVCDLIQLDPENNHFENGIKAEKTFIIVKNIDNEDIKLLFIGSKIGEKVNFNPKKAFNNIAEVARLLGIEEKVASDLDCNFECFITKIERNVPAEFNQEFYKKVFPNSDIETEEQFREEIRNKIDLRNQIQERQKFAPRIKEYLLGKISIQLPDEFLKTWYLKRNEKITLEKLEAEWDLIAKDAKWQTILDELVTTYNIEVEDDDTLEVAKDDVKMYFQYYGMMDVNDDQITALAAKNLEKEEDHDRYYTRALERKTIDKIIELIDVEYVYLPYDEFVKSK